MKRESLMIGDWVYVPHNGRASHNGKVEAIYESGTISVELEGAGCLCHAESLDPIPLTAEILEKNGFVYNAIPFVDGWEQFGLTLYRGGNGYRIDCGINVSLIIDYVHELQHALRLCGISKDITL